MAAIKIGVKLSRLLFVACVAVFVRSGYIRLQDGQANNVGYEASTRSRTAYSAANAYYLNSNPTNVNPSNANNRYYGFPLRWGGRGAVPIFGKNMHFLGKYAIIKVF